jgi:hypothetical protein
LEWSELWCASLRWENFQIESNPNKNVEIFPISPPLLKAIATIFHWSQKEVPFPPREASRGVFPTDFSCILKTYLKNSLSNFSPSFKFKICQSFKINQPKLINCHILGDFCLPNFKFLTDFEFKTRWEIGRWIFQNMKYRQGSLLQFFIAKICTESTERLTLHRILNVSIYCEV